MNNVKLGDWLEDSIVIARGEKMTITIPALTTLAKYVGAVVGSIVILTYFGVGAQYHLPRAAMFFFYGLAGYEYIKRLKVWTLSAQSPLKSALPHAFLNALGWSILCAIGTLIMHEDVMWAPTLAVFAYVFTVILLSDACVWAVRAAWPFSQSKDQ